ncbi:hypothetical protein STCU_00990 [Strigomonas culicis]|uniref:Transmembrane protein n=1 Tax=Strigomonas culicis TaxID=28005 RepID=S9W1C9_9TRYP|nr:hypothetical protein STCU_04577 [Strigomonas culicis]EPY33226.1 hypothetical protein STCU_02402 [Strigomonas culicis]EPY35684.1 hypothetical protein STCU_00990 [Strigomonas culicis]|eukprot:EPY29396.1 hypothetical protein STCU_04577 [Strigomonas culicis]
MVALQTVGLLSLLVYFVADLYYARYLSSQRDAHPELEECAPTESPEVDTTAAFENLTVTAVNFLQEGRQRLAGQDGAGARETYASAEAAPSVLGASSFRANPIHTTVVLCSVLAPVLALLTLVASGLLGWTLWTVPTALSLLVTLSGIAAAGLYAVRSFNLSQAADMSKTQWISMMWFRVDFIFVMAAVALLGPGAWLIAFCMFGSGAYMAHRLMKIERHFGSVQRQTQLMRGEVDLSRVHVPGSKESKQAMGLDDGYSALV